MIRAALLAVVLLTMPAHAAAPSQAGTAENDPVRAGARTFLARANVDGIADALIVGSRPRVIETFKRQGLSEPVAAQVADVYVLPALRVAAPDLMRPFEDVLVEDFTGAELQAMLGDTDGPARTRAKAKTATLPARFTTAGQQWGQAVGVDVYATNKAALDALGLNNRFFIP